MSAARRSGFGRAALAGAAGLALAGLPGLAAEPVRIRVDYSFSGTTLDGARVGPVAWAVGAALSEGGKVVDSWQGSQGSGGGSGRLGGLWRVVGPSELARITDYPNNQVITRVRVDGRTCRASVEARLKPGKSVYTLRSSGDRSTVEFAEVRYAEVRCAIE